MFDMWGGVTAPAGGRLVCDGCQQRSSRGGKRSAWFVMWFRASWEVLLLLEESFGIICCFAVLMN